MIALSPPRDKRRARAQWFAHRLALTLAVSAPESEDFLQGVRWLTTTDKGLDRGAFLSRHGLAAGVAARLERVNGLSPLPAALGELLANELRTASVMYLAQMHSMSMIISALERHDITYVVLKGLSLREEVYTEPTTRVAGDADLLVHPSSLAATERLLIQHGFRLHSESERSAHERTYSNGHVDVDLHWDVLRPGRTRYPVVESMLSGRIRGKGLWRPSDADTVFLMLVHPAFAKYVCSPHMGLNRVLDFILFTNSRQIDWAAVEKRLDDTGMKAAGWCTLHWFRLVTPLSLAVPVSFVDAISPGKFRRAYLAFWIEHDLPGRLLGRCDWFIRGAFTLLLHDRAHDAWRALRARLEPYAITRDRRAGVA